MLALVPLAAFLLAARVHAEDWNSLEYAVKATFVYKFAPFVTWPGAMLSRRPFVICMSGKDHVTPLMADAVRGQQIEGKPIAVKEVNLAEDVDGCAILYAAAPDTRKTRTLLSAARGKPILTITDRGGADAHGIIDFRVLQGHVRFDIDQGLAVESKLTISSKLLNLAHAVTPRPEP